MVDAGMSPLLRDLCAKVAPIEARIAILDAEIAARTQEVEGLRATLAGISRALDPEQVTLPLPGPGTTDAAPKPRRRWPSRRETRRSSCSAEVAQILRQRSSARRRCWRRLAIRLLAKMLKSGRICNTLRRR